jgi:uncharacterized lipoprotein YddW (UPF0748 family)
MKIIPPALLALAVAALLAACAPQEPHMFRNGMACKQVGYTWAIRGYWMSPDGQIC